MPTPQSQRPPQMSLLALHQNDQMIPYPLAPVAAMIPSYCLLLSIGCALGLKPLLCHAFHIVLRCCSKREMMTLMQMAVFCLSAQKSDLIFLKALQKKWSSTQHIQRMNIMKKLLWPWFRDIHVCVRKELALGIVGWSTKEVKPQKAWRCKGLLFWLRLKKKNNKAVIKEKMQLTFSYRWQEILQEPMIRRMVSTV